MEDNEKRQVHIHAYMGSEPYGRKKREKVGDGLWSTLLLPAITVSESRQVNFDDQHLIVARLSMEPASA